MFVVERLWAIIQKEIKLKLSSHSEGISMWNKSTIKLCIRSRRHSTRLATPPWTDGVGKLPAKVFLTLNEVHFSNFSRDGPEPSFCVKLKPKSCRYFHRLPLFHSNLISIASVKIRFANSKSMAGWLVACCRDVLHSRPKIILEYQAKHQMADKIRSQKLFRQLWKCVVNEQSECVSTFFFFSLIEG